MAEAKAGVKVEAMVEVDLAVARAEAVMEVAVMERQI